MRIRITAKGGYANPKRGIDAECGAYLTVDDTLAAKLQFHGIAVAVPEPKRTPPVETAAVAPPENVAHRTHKPRTRKGPQ